MMSRFQALLPISTYVATHRWVAEEIASREPQGIIHQELNAWAIKTLGDASTSGRLPLAYTEAAGDPNRLGVIEQAVGRAGAVVLLHPW